MLGDAERKRSFANYLTEPAHLIAVSASANRSKGKSSPDEWLPDNEDATLDGSLDWYCSENGLKAMSPECRASNDPLCGL